MNRSVEPVDPWECHEFIGSTLSTILDLKIHHCVALFLFD